MELKWKTNLSKLPHSEVLAIGYQDEVLVGYLSEENGDVSCESAGEVLDEVEGYILVTDLVKSFKAINH